MKEIVENDTVKAVNKSMSPRPMVFKRERLSLKLAYIAMIKIKKKMKVTFRITEFTNSSGSVLL
ncbi:hypothetical protein MBM09_08290 [Flaviramulus sp. BrNp1-15]|uniref:hypothetical protein n=1 Tax=Flaviramulus sp. BrNp1-15 TaxID=2916754 RepID=UPI001EE7F829|nr:hypothetical protein [Flaviramulus sp. BrNp1-15]ULC57918.1 hypothetical protein MBM09_08290 [Flaviramulus sp. BrNp1-15]